MTIKLLHVEDDLDILEIALMSLEFSGAFDVLQCSSPTQAIEVAQGFAPDVLLMDMMMPGMSGADLLGRLRALPGLEATPAIFMTARAQPHEIRALMDQGAKDVIVKPFDSLKLAGQIQDILARP